MGQPYLGKIRKRKPEPKNNKNNDETQTTTQTSTKGVKEAGEWTEVLKKGSKGATTPHQQQQQLRQGDLHSKCPNRGDAPTSPAKKQEAATPRSLPSSSLKVLLSLLHNTPPPNAPLPNITAADENSTLPSTPLPNNSTPRNTPTPNTSRHSSSHKKYPRGGKSFQVDRQALERDISSLALLRPLFKTSSIVRSVENPSIFQRLRG